MGAQFMGGIEMTECLVCGEQTEDALYCSWGCFDSDDGKLIEAPTDGELLYVTEWEYNDSGEFVALEQKRIRPSESASLGDSDG